MGLRRASTRRPHLEVMAPALTDQNFKLQHLPSKYTECGIMSENPEMGLHKTSLDTKPDPMFNSDVEELMQTLKNIPDDDAIIDHLLDDDVMNMSIEDPKSSWEESLTDLKSTQNRIERRLDFLRRKIRKLQARTMSQHVSGEVAGVFEYVHRSLKRLKEAAEDKPAMKPMSSSSTKTMLKKLEMAATLQANSMARQKPVPRYFGSGSCEPGNQRITVPGVVNVPPWPTENKQELQKVTGLLRTELGLVQKEVDSEATESSSGGESCDEMQNYNNPHQQYLSIQKRALWKYASQRAAIASRWTWLQAQISDLEYRIRQHGDIQRQIRTSKGEICLGGASPPPPASPTAVNGYRGQLPGSSPLSAKAEDAASSINANGAYLEHGCARTRPLTNFKKRKLLQLNGLHVISKKAARPSTTRCGCVKGGGVPCAVCTGRTDPTHPRDPTDALSKEERVALVDPGFHPVFSMPEDISYAVHCEAIMKNPEWQQRSTRMKSLKVLKNDRSDKGVLEHRSKKIDHRKKYNRLLKPSTMSALSAKIRNKIRGRKSGRHSSSSSSLSFKKKPKMAMALSYTGDGADEEVESIGNNSAAALNSAAASPSSSPLLHMQAISGYSRKNRANSYDIDNIVIPYSVAASTRVEKLQYKEILTPKWRIADIDLKCDMKNNGAVRNPSQEGDEEDLSEEAVVARHEKSEYEEKKKFLSYLKLPTGHGRSRAHKRTDSLAESSGANTPDPLSPHPVEPIESTNSPLTSPPATPLPEDLPSVSAMRRRTISQSRFGKDREVPRDENNTPENVEVAPFDTRTFPLDDETYEKMLKNMPEDHQFKTNYRAQDCDLAGYLDEKADSPGSESTESAIGEEDPNDPEWVDMERVRDRHKR